MNHFILKKLVIFRSNSTETFLNYDRRSNKFSDSQFSLDWFQKSSEASILNYSTFIDTYENEDTFSIYEELVYDSDAFLNQLDIIRK